MLGNILRAVVSLGNRQWLGFLYGADPSDEEIEDAAAVDKRDTVVSNGKIEMPLLFLQSMKK